MRFKYLTRGKDATGLLHISDRLLADELSRVEAARGALHPLPNVELSKCMALKGFNL